MKKTNGFPNIFWGWGGEDDAMRERCKINGIIPRKTNIIGGKIMDIEQNNFGNKMNLEEKLQFLKNNSDLEM